MSFDATDGAGVQEPEGETSDDADHCQVRAEADAAVSLDSAVLSNHGHGARPVENVRGALRDAAGHLDWQTVEGSAIGTVGTRRTRPDLRIPVFDPVPSSPLERTYGGDPFSHRRDHGHDRRCGPPARGRLPVPTYVR